MNQKLQGIVPPLITPLLDSDTLDIEGLEKLIEHVIKGGVHGIFILGTTGEGPSLSFRLQTELIRESSRILNKRLPLLVGISHTSIVESIRLSQVAYEAGADAVVSAPPYYFTLSQSELVQFYENLVHSLELPLYLYNMPNMTKVSFAPTTIRRIADHPNVIGFKDSSGNGTYFQSVLHAMSDRDDFSFFVGPEEMMAEAVMMGADGGVNGGANIFPKLYVDLYHAALEGNSNRVQQLQAKVMQVSSTIYNVGKNGSSFLMGMKCALSVLGLCQNVLAQPYQNFDSEHSAVILKALNDLQFLKTEPM
ncbi:dihydrodipicolinate synthase family protein [Draconibacterium sediminis]|uniref:Dihydrodipicolinate synthase n=1 Tax=Draconibacterium sediminis TaxID=1544798 RepID=A0A0D8JGA2_9BACT|nr:dihydrodipicolinate synthase family protein [Draconibacterium sediminis]KJF45719.1 dihydrodipicolinate synthase [Draconibacterium sediminis]